MGYNFRVRPDKFFPPQVDTPQFLYRERIVVDLVRRSRTLCPNIILEAQAGQGKTTIIRQFLDHIDTPSVWYQVGLEDTDPAFFLKAVQACVSDYLPNCSSTGDNSLSDSNLGEKIDLLLKDLRSHLLDDLYIVFDDLHNLVAHESSLFVLNYLVNMAPPQLHFILSSRDSLPMDIWQSSSETCNKIMLGNRDLALNKDEVADFFQQVFHLPISHETIEKIANHTNGWVMGILLLGLQMRKRGDAALLSASDVPFEKGHPDVLNYFRREVFASLDKRLHRPLLILSLLEKIDVAFAEKITGDPEIGKKLYGLVQRNMFLRQLGPDNATYGMHHLFRQFLRERAQNELSREDVLSIYKKAGEFCAEREDVVGALRYLMQAEDYDGFDVVLRQNGMVMLAANQTAALAAILEQAPTSALSGMGWAGFFLALAHMDIAPVKALPMLTKAMTAFSARQDELGELLCLSHMISIHITITGHYREGEDLLVRAEQLFSKIAGSIDSYTTILVARSLGMGCCIFMADTETAMRYATLALNLSRKVGSLNFEAALLMIMGYIQIFAGRMSLARVWLEQAAPFANYPEVGTFNRLAIRMMLFNFLFHDGDFSNYFLQKNQLVASIGNTLVSQSIAGPFCSIWEMDIAINRGDFDAALETADRVMAIYPCLSPHLYSQILQLKAVALALKKEADQALAVAAESMRLRSLAGGPYFVALNKLMVGLVHAYCGDHERGDALLMEGLRDAGRMPTSYLVACGLLQRAAFRLDVGDDAMARRDIETGLGLMSRNAYQHFWAWPPNSMRKVLSFAVANGIESDYARNLAAGRMDMALLENGMAIPLIEIRTLGGFSIFLHGKPLLTAEALTPAQRELLCLLIASPGMKIPQDIAQAHFWPDGSPAAVKVKFDTLLSRLRKTLAEALPDAFHYLNREKGMLWLAHCRVDAIDFIAAVEAGLKHFRLQEFWQAGNAFSRAETLWQGEFAPGIVGETQVRAFRDILSGSLTRMAQTWCEKLVEADDLPRAIMIAEKAWNNDLLNDALCGLLYRLHGRTSAVKARQVLKRFTQLLRTEGYLEKEISELTDGMLSAKPPRAIF